MTGVVTRFGDEWNKSTVTFGMASSLPLARHPRHREQELLATTQEMSDEFDGVVDVKLPYSVPT